MSKVAETCDRLCALFVAEVPLPERLAQQRRKPAQAEIARLVEQGLERFYAAAREERQRRHLGIFARARVAFALQQRLLAAGYEAPLVKQVLFAMLTQAFISKQCKQ